MMRLTIIGFGNQAKSWALNLKDSHFPFRVALRSGSPSFEEAQKLQIETVEIDSSDFYSDQIYALLTPDEAHKEFLDLYGMRFSHGTKMIYAHGFSLIKHRLESVFPHLDHVLFAPKSIGSELRNQFLSKGKLGAVYSLEHLHDKSGDFKTWLFKLSHSLGINMGPFETSFEHETQADLYSEQGLLCSLIPYAAHEMFTHLTENGIEPELAYFECWYELKLIINAMIEKGPKDFFDLISPNALIGSEKGYQTLFSPSFRESLKHLFSDIKSGKFNREIEATNVKETRSIIKSRWEKSPLQKTFQQIHQDYK